VTGTVRRRVILLLLLASAFLPDRPFAKQRKREREKFPATIECGIPRATQFACVDGPSQGEPCGNDQDCEDPRDGTPHSCGSRLYACASTADLKPCTPLGACSGNCPEGACSATGFYCLEDSNCPTGETCLTIQSNECTGPDAACVVQNDTGALTFRPGPNGKASITLRDYNRQDPYVAREFRHLTVIKKDDYSVQLVPGGSCYNGDPIESQVLSGRQCRSTDGAGANCTNDFPCESAEPEAYCQEDPNERLLSLDNENWTLHNAAIQCGTLLLSNPFLPDNTLIEATVQLTGLDPQTEYVLAGNRWVDDIALSHPYEIEIDDAPTCPSGDVDADDICDVKDNCVHAPSAFYPFDRCIDTYPDNSWVVEPPWSIHDQEDESCHPWMSDSVKPNQAAVAQGSAATSGSLRKILSPVVLMPKLAPGQQVLLSFDAPCSAASNDGCIAGGGKNARDVGLSDDGGISYIPLTLPNNPCPKLTGHMVFDISGFTGGFYHILFAYKGTSKFYIDNVMVTFPDSANPDQADADVDGRGDVCDRCPADAGNDADADGICGDTDNCPGLSNPTQTNTDGDALGDACDTCPADPANDSDGDGRCANVDNCPDISNSTQTNTDGDLLGDACDPCPSDPTNDVDQDGICGGVDNCPLVSNATQDNADGDALGDACDPCTDADADGSCRPADCNDSDLQVFPGARELCDGLDNDCSGLPDDITCSNFDADHNGRVDGLELAWLGRAFTLTSVQPVNQWWFPIDFTADGTVDGDDLSLLALAWACSAPQPLRCP
jgi:hypothetical protein